MAKLYPPCSQNVDTPLQPGFGAGSRHQSVQARRPCTVSARYSGPVGATGFGTQYT